MIREAKFVKYSSIATLFHLKNKKKIASIKRMRTFRALSLLVSAIREPRKALADNDFRRKTRMRGLGQ